MSVNEYTEGEQLAVVANLDDVILLRKIADKAISIGFRKSEMIEEYKKLTEILKNTIEVQERTIETYKRIVDSIDKVKSPDSVE